MQVAELGKRKSHGCFPVSFTGNVGGHKASRIAEHVSQRLTGLSIQVGNYHPAAFSRHHARNGCAKA
jgi:hypothetical protein